MSNQYLITTEPRLELCRKCSTTVLAATIGGLNWQVDTTAVTTEGELRALLAGMATFELRGGQLVDRSPEMIRAGARGPVLIEHTCRPIPDRYVDHTYLQAATFLVQRLLGATPVAVEDSNTPAPF